jgi:L-amino acid N-acyltransferase YncA
MLDKSWEIRLATLRDAAAIADIYRPIVESTAISFELEPPDEEEIRHRIEHKLEKYPWLVCENGGRVAGYAYASQFRERAAYQWSVETSVYVHADFRRFGIGRALYASLFPMLKAQGFFSAYAGITLPNPGSVGLHEAVGFRAVGVYRNVGYKMGAWHDVGMWVLPLKSTDSVPEPPLKLSEIQSSPSWQQMLTAGLQEIRL